MELSSFSGNSSQAIGSSPRSSEPSPRLTPLPEQLESADSAASQQALDRWDHSPGTSSQKDPVREYELSVMDRAEGTQHLPNNMPAAALLNQTDTPSSPSQRHARNSSVDQQDFHTPKGSPGSQSELDSALFYKVPTQEAAVDELFPSIRKITPMGSPEDDTLHASPLLAELMADNPPHSPDTDSQVLP